MKAAWMLAAAALALAACQRAGPHGPPNNASAAVDSVASDAPAYSDAAMSSAEADSSAPSDMVEVPVTGSGPHGPPAT